MAHSLKIGASEYFVQGNDTETLKTLADKLAIKYDSIETSKLSESQTLIRIWKIGELSDYLNNLVYMQNLKDRFKGIANHYIIRDLQDLDYKKVKAFMKETGQDSKFDKDTCILILSKLVRCFILKNISISELETCNLIIKIW